MKTWAWIIGGVGAATGAWLLFRNRTSEAAPPMSDVSWYPDGGLLEPVGTGETVTESAAVGAPTGETSAAPPVSTYYVEPATNTATGAGSATALDAGAPQSSSVAAPAVSAQEATGAQVAPSGVPKDAVGVPQFVPLTPCPAKVSVTTYKSPVTSSTRTVVAPVIPRTKAPVLRTVAAPLFKPSTPLTKPLATVRPVIAPVIPQTKAPALQPATTPLLKPSTTPLTKPLAVVRPVVARGPNGRIGNMYAVGADFTEAEYRAMGARAEIETKHREWAASQMSEHIAALQRDR